MARKRDHKAEYQRRQELAKQRGFRSRAQERYAREKETWKSAGYDSYAEYRKARAEASKWSDRASKKSVSKFDSSFNPVEVKDYRQAFGIGGESFSRDKLAEFLHDREPDEYPDTDNEDFWEAYF